MDEDDDYDEFVDNASMCESCQELTEHEILKQREVSNGFDMLVKCTVCGNVNNLQIREPKSRKISFILTDGPNSQKTTIVVDSDEKFLIGDVFEEDEKLWTINQIMNKNNQKIKQGVADEVSIISALRTDMVRVKITTTSGEYSDSTTLLTEYGTTFTAGHLMDYEGETWRIRAIHTGEGRTLKGTIEAQDIKRMYLHEPPKQEHFEPKTPRERRQAWKEGRLGYNPNPEVPKEITKKRVRPQNRRKKKQPRK